VRFEDFYGNAETVRHLRESIRGERFPHSLILAGPKGAGKNTLGRAIARPIMPQLGQ